MKQQVRVGVLASLLMAPAVLASASGLTNLETDPQQNTQGEVAAVHPLVTTPAVIPTNETVEISTTTEPAQVTQKLASLSMPIATLASTSASTTSDAGSVVNAITNIDEARVKELKEIGETSLIANYDKYREWISELKDKGVISENQAGADQVQFLKDKITYLEKFYEIQQQALIIKEELKLLKPTNANVIAVVEDLTKKLADLESDYKEIRNTFHDQYNKFYKKAVTFAEQSVSPASMPNFNSATENFLKNNFADYAKFEEFKRDIVKPYELINGKSFTDGTSTPDTAGITDPAKLVLFENLYALDPVPTEAAKLATYAIDMRKAYDELILFYTTEFTTREKQIFESHLYAADTKGRTIGEILDEMKEDLDEASDVEELIQETIQGINALTASKFNSTVSKLQKEYNKLTDRQRAMVVSYKTHVDIDGTEDDMVGAYNVSSTISNLKPSNKEEYRQALFDARVAYESLSAAKGYVKNEDVLVTQETDFKKAVGAIKGTGSSPDTPAINATTNLIDIDYGTGAAMTVEGLIAALKTNTNRTAADIVAARDAYNVLTSKQRKLINNYKELQNWEKMAKKSISLEAQIDKIKIENTKKFASAVDKANKAKDKLTADQQSLITNLGRLEYLTPYAAAINGLNKLKPSNKPEYRDSLNSTHTDIYALTLPNPELTTGDTAALTGVQTELKQSIDDKKTVLTKIEALEALINATNAMPTGTVAEAVARLEKMIEAREQYDALTKDERKIVNNLKTLTAMEKAVGQPLKVIKAIDAVDPENKSFASKAKSAVSAYEKLTSSLKNYIDQDRQNKITNFKRYLALADLVKALKSSDPAFERDVDKVRDELNQLKSTGGWEPITSDVTYVPKLIAAVILLEPKVAELEEAEANAMELDKLIEQLANTTDYEAFYKLADQIEMEYSQLSSDGKKLVKNYKEFQQLKKDSTAAHKVIQMINNRTIYMEDVANAGYVKAIESAVKAYDKLTPAQKRYVYNYASILEPQLRIVEVVKMIHNLKPTSKTYLDDLTSARLAYNSLSADDQKKLEPIYYKLTNGEVGIEDVRKVIQLINEAVPGVEDYVKKLQEARAAYDHLASLSPSYQKLVTNYKTLQQREKALKPVMDSVYQIQELQELIVRPMNDASIFVKKYNAAVKAYEKVPYESRQLVHNRHVLLTEIYPVASTMEAILKIKPSSKTFSADVRKAREWYDGLISTDKGLITNYSDLVAFEQIVSGGSEVDQLIAAIPSTPISNYMQAIKDARAAYNALLPDEKKAVTLYKELQTYEKGVKNVLTAIDAIDNLQHAPNLVKAYDKAQKALDKLTSDERQMVTNLNKLQSVGPAIEVYKQIESLKPSQDNYAGAVQAVYAAYNRLSSVEKQYVTNFASLQAAKNDVDNLAEVISKITSITPGSRDYARQVQEALALYNTLPAALKKLVPNYEMLKNSEKELGAAERVRGMISEIDVNSTSFVQKTLAAREAYEKLTSNEKRLVSNYFMLEDYEFQLGNMF